MKNYRNVNNIDDICLYDFKVDICNSLNKQKIREFTCFEEPIEKYFNLLFMCIIEHPINKKEGLFLKKYEIMDLHSSQRKKEEGDNGLFSEDKVSRSFTFMS